MAQHGNKHSRGRGQQKLPSANHAFEHEGGLQALEPRLLLSADLVAGVDTNGIDHEPLAIRVTDPAPQPSVALRSNHGEISANGSAGHSGAEDRPPSSINLDGLDRLQSRDLASSSLSSHSGDSASTSANTSSSRSEIVFIDGGVEDYQSLLADLSKQIDAGREIDMHVLDTQRDGVAQITEFLANRSNLQAIHLVSHGSDGRLALGNISLSNDTLGEHRSAIASWSAALSDEADLLIYGCEVAQFADGKAFVDELAVLTGADVAASADLTGAMALGGDWELEHAVGHIETKIAFGEQLRHGWMSTLDVLAFQQGVAGYSGSIDTQLDASSPTTNHGGNAEIEVDSSPQRQALIRFEDLVGAGANQIPLGATINSATLTLEVTNSTALGKIDLHKLLVDWTEASTWNSTVGGIQLDDVEAEAARQSRLANADQSGAQSFEDLAGSVQRWVDGEANFGWVIVNDDLDSWRFATTEHGTLSIRPTLTVDYTTPAVDTTLRVNAQLNDEQVTPETGGNAVARLPNGNTMVVWSSKDQDDNSDNMFGVFAQLYDASGARIAPEIQVNTYTDDDQLNPAIAADSAGNFVVVWQSKDQDGDGFGVYAQRFDAAGNKLGPEIAVNTHISNEQTSPAVAMDADGDFVVVWQSDDQDGDGWGIYAQRFDSAGNHLGGERLVNTFSSFDQFDASVAMDADGDFVVTWTADTTPGGDKLDIRGQRFDALGNTRGLEFQINSYLTNDQSDSSVAMNADGDFVVVWTSDGQDGDSEGIYGRTFNRDGSARGPDFLVPTLLNKEQEHATVSMQSNGDFIVSWTHRDTDSIYHRQFNLDGLAQSAQILADTDTNNQKYAAIAVDGSGRISVAWSADHPSNDDKGVYIKLSTLPNNLKPTLALPGLAINYAESDPATVLDSAATVADADSSNFDGGALTIEFTSGGTANDRLEIRNEGTGAGEVGVSGLTVSYGGVDIGTFSGGTDGTTPLVVSLNTAASVAATEALARNITYRNVSEGPSTNARQVRMYLSDGDGGTSLAARKDINVSIVNDAPTIIAPASENTVENTTVTFEPPGNAISISDLDIGSEELKVTLSVTNGELNLGTTNNLTFLVGDGSADQVMVFTGSQADVNTALDGLEFTPTNLFVGTAEISLEVDDQGVSGSGGAQVTSATIDVIVASDGTNDAPRILDPGDQSTVEDQPLFFSLDNANQFQLQDDAGGSPVEVTLTVTDGSLTLSDTTGLSFSSGDGTGDSNMTLSGTIADINAAIDGMYFQPTPGFFGTATLDLDISDLGNTDGNPLAPEIDTASIDIDVDVRNRAPSVLGPAEVVTLEATPFIFNAGNLISFADVDHGNQDLEVTLSVTHGTLTLGTAVGLAFTLGDGSDDTAMTFKGELSELNPALNGLSFTPESGYAGGAVLQIGINDLGNTGAGGALADQHTVSIDITPDGSNAAPLNSVPGPQVTAEETPIVFSGAAGNQISVNDDIGAGNLTVTLTATDGTVSLSNTVGSEFQVNTDVSGDQHDAQTAMAPDGRFVVVWTSAGQDGSGDGVYAQLYDPSGTAVGAEIRINLTTAGNQHEPAVAMDDSGNFVVVWTSDGQDGSSRGVYARQFDAVGTPASTEFLVNTHTSDEQRNAAVAMDADGDFAVVWQSKSQDSGGSWGVYGKRFDAAGSALDVPAGPPGVKEFRVNSETANDQRDPVIAMDDAGNFAVAWQSKDQDGDDYGVFAKRYDAAGNELDSPLTPPGAAEFQVNTVFFKDQVSPSIAMDSDGDFVIAWQSEKQDHPSGADAWGVYGQRFDAAGNTQGVNFLVNSTVTRDQQAPAVAMDASGAFVIAWQAENQDHADKKAGVYAQRYDLAGNASGKEFLVNTTTQDEQQTPSIAMGSDGKFVTAWQSKGQDQGASWGVYGQRYDDIRSLNFLAGDGEDDALVTFQGTVDEINDALDGLVFTPDVDFVGPASLNIVTDDGVTAADDDTVDITVNPVNDAPAISAPISASTNEGVPLVFSVGGGNPVTVGDIDIAGAEPVRIVLLATQGTLNLSGTSGLSFSVGDGADDAAMTFTGSLADVNAALDGMSFTALPTFAGDANVQITIDDQGNIGSEPALSASASVAITVNADTDNDAPVIELPGAQRTPIDTALVLGESNGTLVSISDDAASNPVEITLTVSNGTISLSQLVSSEQQVNSYFTGNQQAASVSTAANGSYVVVWQSNGQDGDGYGIYGQRYSAQGQPAGSEFRVNVTTTSNQQQPVVAVSADGQFAVAWQSNAQDGNGEGIYARMFDASGVPLGDEVLVNAFTQGNQVNPSIAIDGTGNSVVVWESAGQDGDALGVFAQRFDAAGVALGSEFQVNTVSAGNQRNASVAMNTGGDFVVVWQGKDVAGEGILAQRYDADGNTVGDEFLVTSVTLENQTLPDVAMDDAGNVVVVWQSKNEDGDGEGIVGRRFDAAGLPLGANFAVTTTTIGNQTAPSVDMNAAGEFFVVWQDKDANGEGIFGQRFAGNGAAVGTQLSLNTTPVGDQEAPGVAIDNNGNVITAWTSSGGQDGDGDGVFSQRLANFGGLTFISGDGEADSTVVVRGTLANINDALANMMFTPEPGFTGLATIQIDVDDLGYSGSGGPLSDRETLDIIVGDGPLMDLDADNSSGGVGSNYAAVFAAGAVPIADADALISDLNTGDLLSLTVTITNQIDGIDERLAANTVGTSIFANYDDLTGILSLTGLDTLAHYEQVLRSVTYQNLAATPSETARVITFIANDGSEDSNVATATVEWPDKLPTASNNTVATNEDTAHTFTLANFAYSDADGDPLVKVRITALETVGSLELSATPVVLNQEIAAADIVSGFLKFIPLVDANGSGYDSFDFQVHDGSAYSLSTYTMSVDVNAVGDTPQVPNAGTLEDIQTGAIVVDRNANDGAEVTHFRISNIIGGSLYHNDGTTPISNGDFITYAEGNAGLKFTPALNRVLPASFDVEASEDGVSVAAQSGATTSTITITPVNDVPVATGNTVIANEDVPLLIGAGDFNFTDVELDGLASVTITGLNLNGGTLTHSAGAVTVTNGMTITAAQLADLTFTSALNDSTDSSFTYTVNDAGAGVTSAVMNVTVNAVNDVPVATGNTVIANEDVPLVIGVSDFNFSDVELDGLASVTITGLNLNGGTLTHTAGSVPVTNGMTITAAQLADLTFTSALNDSTDSSFTYTVNDAGAGVTSAVMNVTVNAVNDVPVATGNTVIASEDVPLLIGVADFNFSDAELDGLASVTITGLNLNGGTLTHTAGSVPVTNGMTITAAQLADLTFTSALNDSTDSSFTYTVNDAGAGVTSAVMNVTVNAVNDVPVATGNTVIASEDVPLLIGVADFNFSDVELDGLASVTITGLNLNGGTLTHTAGSVPVTNGMTITAAQLADLTFTSALNDSTDSSFTYTVNDAGLGVTSAVMNITVNAVNDVPVASGESATTDEDAVTGTGSGEANLLANDSDPDTGETATLSIAEVNGMPANVGIPIVLASGATLTVNANGTWAYDPGTSATFNALAVGGPNGADSFNYTVTDVNGATSTATVNLTITPSNDGPTATGESATTDENSVTGTGGGAANLLANDTDPDTGETSILSIAEVNGTPANVGTPIVLASGATLTVNANGTWVYDPSTSATFNALTVGGPNSADSFSYTVTDVNGATSTATMSLTITPDNDGPVASGESVTTDEDSAAGTASGDTNLLANDTDADSGESATLSIAAVNGVPANVGTLIVLASGATLTVNSNGTWAYDPSTSVSLQALAVTGPTGADSFNYTVTDVNGATSTATVNLTITPLNDAPAGSDKMVATVLNTDYTFITLDFGFTDLDGDSLLAVRLAGGPTAGTLLNGVTVLGPGAVIPVADIVAGNLIFRPAAGVIATGYATFTFQVQDDAGGTDTDLSPNTITVDVDPLNLPPSGADDTITLASAGTHTFAVADFGFSDTDGDALLALRIASLPGTGTLLLNGSAVTAGQWVAATDIAAGRLVYAAPAGMTTNSFTFQVQDTGGGSDLDPSANTISLNIVAATPAPTGGGITPAPPPLPTPLPSGGAPTIAPSPSPSPSPSPAPSTSGATPGTAQPGLSVKTSAAATPAASEGEGLEALAPAVDFLRSLNDNAPTGPASMFNKTLVALLASLPERVAMELLSNPLPTADALQQVSLQRLTQGIDFQQALDALRDDLVAPTQLQQIVLVSSLTTTAALSVGYVIWLLRGGMLLASFLSTMPAWRLIDPIPILAYAGDEDEDAADESLESLLEDKGHTTIGAAPSESLHTRNGHL